MVQEKNIKKNVKQSYTQGLTRHVRLDFVACVAIIICFISRYADIFWNARKIEREKKNVEEEEEQ